MHGRPSAASSRIKALANEIRCEMRKPFQDYRRMKSMLLRVYNLERGLNVN